MIFGRGPATIKGEEMTDRMNLIMLEIERIVQAKLDDGQTVEDLEKDFDKLVLECLPALTARNRQVGNVNFSLHLKQPCRRVTTKVVEWQFCHSSV